MSPASTDESFLEERDPRMLQKLSKHNQAGRSISEGSLREAQGLPATGLHEVGIAPQPCSDLGESGAVVDKLPAIRRFATIKT